MKNFESCNVQELSKKEINEIEGGFIPPILGSIIGAVALILLLSKNKKDNDHPKGSGAGGSGMTFESQMNIK